MPDTVPYTVAADRQSTSLLDAVGAHFMNHFRFAPHYELVDTKRYICFVPLITTWALLPEVKAPVDPNHHIFALIHDHILTAAAEGRCTLVFDTSSEGDPLIEKAYHSLHAWLTLHNISDSNVLIVNQNRNLGNQYRLMFGRNIHFSYYDSFVKRLLNIFGSDSADFERRMGFSIDSIRFREVAPKPFLYLNGAPRSHRIVIAAALLAKGLLDSATWSMLGTLSKKLDPSVHAAKQLKAELGVPWVSDTHIDAIFAEMPKVISDELQSINNIRGSDQLALSINAALFDYGFASIVTETEFTNGSVKRISEITLKPFVMGHPTVVFGNPFSLRLLRDIGFRTFDNLLDENYDTILDPTARFESVINSLVELHRLIKLCDKKIIDGFRLLCEHNILFGRNRASQAYEEGIERLLLKDILACISS